MSKYLRILVIDDDYGVRESCRRAFARTEHEVEMVENGAQGMELLGRSAYDVILLDLRLPDVDGMGLLRQIREQDPGTEVIIISGYGSVDVAVAAMKNGAFDFVPKPFTPAELRAAVEKAHQQRDLVLENAYLKEELKRKNEGSDIVSRSPLMKKILNVITRVAPTDTTVLITGESGTGKGLLAKYIHQLSPRRDHPFVAVDCSTLVPTLFESELFGHAKGSFTGAGKSKIGKFELSNGGTLFLDEVSNISLEIQAKLLRAVEERTVFKVGSNREIRVDTRLVAATNRSLSEAVEAGTFREDLYYRLNVMPVNLPPLRERPEDIPVLAEYFLEKFAGLALGRERRKTFTKGALELLSRHAWPGNVRELENTVQRLVILADDRQIEEADIRFAMPTIKDQEQGELMRLVDVERMYIQKALRKMSGQRTLTAKALGIDRKTLRQKMRKYGLDA